MADTPERATTPVACAETDAAPGAAPDATMAQIDRIRAFDRFYAGRLGLLRHDCQHGGLTLTEARVLDEIALGEARTARALAAALGIDQGYLSRVLKRFGANGWLTRRPDPGDGRQKILTLTETGRAVFAGLQARARDEVGALIAGLNSEERAALCRAMERTRGLLDGPSGAVELRDLRPGDAGWIISRHGALYARDEGFDASFEALVAEILAGFLRDHDPGRERGWIAEASGRRLGSIFCVRLDDETAKLRLFLIEPEARGTGLARRMLDTSIDWAKSRGYRRMVLWTHECHRAACALYARRGFTLTESRPAQSFGRDLIEQTWEIAL